MSHSSPKRQPTDREANSQGKPSVLCTARGRDATATGLGLKPQCRRRTWRRRYLWQALCCSLSFQAMLGEGDGARSCGLTVRPPDVNGHHSKQLPAARLLTWARKRRGAHPKRRVACGVQTRWRAPFLAQHLLARAAQRPQAIPSTRI